MPLTRFAFLAILMLAPLWLSSCGAGGDGAGRPGDVVKKYISALTSGDIQTASTCIAPEKRQMAAPMLQMGSGIAAGFTKAEGGLDSVTILDEKIEGDRAVVAYQTKTKKGMERRDTVRAEKINGKWFVAQ